MSIKRKMTNLSFQPHRVLFDKGVIRRIYERRVRLVLRTAITPPVWRGAPWLTRLVYRGRNPLRIYCARYLVLCCRNNVRVFGTISLAKTTGSPAPNWRGNGGVQHLALGVPPTPAQVEAANVYAQLCTPLRQLYITAQTAHILHRRSPLFATPLLVETHPLQKGRDV